MNRLKKMVCALGLFAMAAGLMAASPTSPDEPEAKGKKTSESKGKGKKGEDPKAAPGDAPKVIVLQLDASKLPPDVLKKLLELGSPAAKASPPTPPAVKAISLAQAIGVAEKSAKASATKAEKKDGKDGGVQFRIDLVDANGNKAKVTLDAAGKVLDGGRPAEPEATPEPKKKGAETAPEPKKKGKDKEEDGDGR